MDERALTVEEICNKLRPVFGKKIDEIYFQYSIADSREEREEIAHVLNALYQKHLNKLLDKGVLLEPPRNGVIDGTYNLATITYAGKHLFPFKLREHDWPRHVCITGMSGSGKTTLAFNIIESLIKHNKNFLVFDWKKSFRPLLKEDSSIMVFTVAEDKVSNLFKTNINQPPKGVAPKEWINVLSDLLTESFSASFGVHKVLLETLDEAFKEWGIYNGSENYPTWNHIKWRLEEKLEKIQGREAGWIESALRIATVLTFGEFGKTLNYKGKNAFSVEDLLAKRVIMELNALGNIEKKVFCEFVLTYIYRLKKANQNDVGHKFDHAIIVDEAHNIFLKKPTNFSNESVTDMIYREMREYGTSLICLDQHVSKISDTVKGNSACHIAFQQQLPQDIEDISGLMQLRDKKQYFSQLPVGSAIVKLSERYTSPFLIEVPFASVRTQRVTDLDVKSRMDAVILGKEYEENVEPEFNKAVESPQTPKKKEALIEEPKKDSLEGFTEVQKILYQFVKEYLANGVELKDIEKILEQSKTQGKYTSEDIMKVINKVFENQLVVTFKKEEKSKIKTNGSDLTDDQRKFVEFLQENPTHTLSTTEVYRKIGLSARKGTVVKKQLEEKGLIKVEEVKYEKGWKKFIRL
jgi:energy-coupling factor transporter ATP-binding protein EcfA2